VTKINNRRLKEKGCFVGKSKGRLAYNKTECQATLAWGAEVGECNKWSRKNFGSNEWNEPTACTWICEEISIPNLI